MQKPNKKILWIIPAAILAVCLLLLVERRVFPPLSPPRDKALQAQFHRNKSQFEELVRLLKEDENIGAIRESGAATKGSLIPASSLAETGITASRFDQYVRLLKQTGAVCAIHDEEEFRFPVAGSGFASKGYRIAITFRESEPSPLLASLDDFRKTTTHWEQAYRKIEQNWYLWIIW